MPACAGSSGACSSSRLPCPHCWWHCSRRDGRAAASAAASRYRRRHRRRCRRCAVRWRCETVERVTHLDGLPAPRLPTYTRKSVRTSASTAISSMSSHASSSTSLRVTRTRRITSSATRLSPSSTRPQTCLSTRYDGVALGGIEWKAGWGGVLRAGGFWIARRPRFWLLLLTAHPPLPSFRSGQHRPHRAEAEQYAPRRGRLAEGRGPD